MTVTTMRESKGAAGGVWLAALIFLPPGLVLFTIFVILPLLAAVLVIPELAPSALSWVPMADAHAAVAAHMNLTAIVFGVGLPDYVMTCLVAVLHRRVRLLFLGLFFPLVRVIDAAIALSAVPAGWFARSNGTWKSPARRAIDAQPEPVPVAVGPPAASMSAKRPESPVSTDYGRERGHAS